MIKSIFEARTSCESIREGLSAMLDGVTTSLEEEALIDHVSECTQCAEYQRMLNLLDAKISDEAEEYCAESDVWANVMSQIEAETTRSNTVQMPRWSLPRLNMLVRASAAVLVVISLMIGDWQIANYQNSGNQILQATLSDFEKYRASGEVLDLTAENPDAVLSWMSSRVKFELPDSIEGFDEMQITGSRLCSFLNRKLAFFAYSTSGGDIGFYITEADGLDFPDGETLSVQTHKGGLVAASWYQDGLAYVAVSDLPIGDLTRIADQMRQWRGASL